MKAGRELKPALTAAASKIGYSRQSAQKIKEAPWQDRAWTVYDKLGAIFIMTRYREHVTRKFDYFAAVVEQPGDDPTIDAVFNDEGEIIDQGQAAKLLQAEGGPEMMRRVVSEFVTHWDVPGEGYLVRFDQAPLWRVLSTQELKKQGDTYTWGNEGKQLGDIDPDGVYRVWKSHPRFHWEADSATKHILEDAEELILIGRELRARSQSRIPAGVWILSDGVDFTPFGDDGNGTEDDFARELTTRMSRPLSDVGAADSLVPWILTMSREDADIAIRGFINFRRDWEIPLEQREALLKSIATGLDLPPEILTGMADLNHWSAWLVSEQAVSQHVTPSVDDILDSLTVNWFRPILMAGGMGEEEADRYVLWRDTSPATVEPDRSDTAIELFDRGIIDDIAVRRVTDYDDEDAPEVEEGLAPSMDADELAKRINALGILRRSGVEWEDAVQTVGLPSMRLIPGLLPITVRAEEVVKNEAPVVAALASEVSAERLTQIDSELLAWVVEASHQEIERLLASLTAADVVESLLDRFAQRLDKRIAQAQTQAASFLSRLLGVTIDLTGADEARTAGVAAIVGSLLATIRQRLFTPQAAPDPIDLGEVPEVAVPVQAIRDGLSIAGGGLPFAEGTKAWELVGNGRLVNDALELHQVRTLQFRWEYGLASREREFPPHKALDGSEFDSWESDTVRNFDTPWLNRSHYKPGDHKGCLCTYTRVLTLALQVPGVAAR